MTVKVNIISEKTVPVKANYKGKPASGFEVISVKTDPPEVTIKGRSEILNSISTITIPENVISVDNVDEKFEQQVDLTKYLPDGVSLSNSKEASIIVKVDVEELERRVFKVPSQNISVDNLPEGYRVEFHGESVDMIIYGLKNDLDELTIQELHPVLDVGGKMAGSHVGQLQLSLDNKYIAGDNQISYTIFSDTIQDNTGQDTGGNDQNQNGPGNTGNGDTRADDQTGAETNTDTDTDTDDEEDRP